jgi:transcriptional regulator with XRE-family HTH domain
MYNCVVAKNDDSKITEDWLNKQFLVWQLGTGKNQSVRSFAKYLEVKETSLSGWMRGEVAPTGTNLYRLGNKLGFEIYDLLGKERPGPEFDQLFEIYERADKEQRSEIIKKVLEFFGYKRIG